ncbi:hypothetical protein AAF712_004497 [Marasmius tenuissimus]|uniref:Peroxidase n=1 Tax=Marasmius tenuissimus TaxID=585030 RepID=A0ABR3A4V9_9AGAR
MISPRFSATIWGLIAASAPFSAVMAIQRPLDFKMERLEQLLWEENFVALTPGSCVRRDQSTLGAEWVRLAYHDMSTHNIDDGTGGLDASIVFELDRPQNVGQGMPDSVNDFLRFTNPGASRDGRSDCDGSSARCCFVWRIPHTLREVELTPPPLDLRRFPHEDLASHTESFSRQGFTQSEMIALVASLGGVRKQDFPELIQTPVEKDIGLFDGTQQFDHAVVTGYLDGTTPNPLVVGPNTTTNSDLRIFASDGNVTMQSLASQENFNKVCSDVLERIINTVPNGVQLTDVVEPIEYKVGHSRLFPGDEAGLFRFTTNIRMLHNNPSRTVNCSGATARNLSALQPDAQPRPSH